MKNILRIELNPNRIYGLDILRALAILFVVAGHGMSLMPDERTKFFNLIIFDGVSMFFVLSGFLIGGILIKLIKEKTINSKLIFDFWVRRWLRTLPNYFLILIILLLLASIFNDNFSLLDYRLYFIFSQNLFSEHPSNFFPEAWSLSVEEWFYLLLPLMLFVSIRLFKISINKSILLTAFGVIISITLFRYFRYISLPIVDINAWHKTIVFSRLDSLMYGVIGAYTYIYYENFWNKHKVMFLLVGILLFVFMKWNPLKFETLGLYGCIFEFLITSIATLCLLPFLSNLKSGKGYVYKLITYISLISYSMYLTNLSIVNDWILKNIDWSLLQNFNGYIYLITRYSLFWILTVLLSILIYKYFEIPIMNLRDKIRIK